jgi:hypothetical protein
MFIYLGSYLKQFLYILRVAKSVYIRFHITYDIASTSLSYLINMAGKGPNWAVCGRYRPLSTLVPILITEYKWIQIFICGICIKIGRCSFDTFEREWSSYFLIWAVT